MEQYKEKLRSALQGLCRAAGRQGRRQRLGKNVVSRQQRWGVRLIKGEEGQGAGRSGAFRGSVPLSLRRAGRGNERCSCR